jgi:DNA invertase Pin-like site-specific DNA recombinase
MNIAYIRVSSKDQNPARQIEEMHRMGIDDCHLFIDYASGKNLDRPQYQKMRQSIQKGDVLYLDALDRLGRNYDDITKEWRYITEDVGADIVCQEPSFMNTLAHKSDGPLGKATIDAFLCVFSYIAQREREEMLRRQAAGIALAKAKGRYVGRKPKKVDKERFRKVCRAVDARLITASAAAKTLNISRTTFFKLRKTIKVA